MRLLQRLLKRLRKRKLVVPANFVVASGVQYHKFFAKLHERYLFDWYMEIGCRSGTSLALVRGKVIGVDPFFQVNINVIGQKPQAHFFQLTSDAFFEGAFLKRSDIRLSLTFLDGMHLIEYLLRDFINTEANSRDTSVIMIHDCCPYDNGMTTRDLNSLDDLPGRIWTGDVWKIIPILQKHRPDLQVTVLDSAKTGVVVVSNLSPGNNVLKDQFDSIMAEFCDIDLLEFGPERFFGSFKFTDAQGFLDNTDFWNKLAQSEELAIKPTKVSL